MARTITLPALPEEPTGGGGLLLGLLTSAGSLGMLGFVGSAGSWLVALVGVGVLAGVVTSVVRSRELRARRREVRARRERWSGLAATAVAEARAEAADLRAAALAEHPWPLVAVRPGTAEDWTVRIGLGPVPAPVVVEVAGLDPLAAPDPLIGSALAELPLEVADVPVLLDLHAAVELTAGQARAVIAQLLVRRRPGWALVAAVDEGWSPLVWCAPAWDPERPGAVRVGASLEDLRALLAAAPSDRLVLLNHPEAHRWAAALPGERVVVVSARDAPASPGELSVAGLEAVARATAPWGSAQPSRSTRLGALLGEQALPEATVALGRLPGGEVLRLDLREAAVGGQGPHGLVVGATGSGKSELLRSVVAQLALGHHPDELALLLVDHKGGAAFAGMASLPHVAGLVTNLGDAAAGTEGPARVRAALGGELDRRQRLLRESGGDTVTGLAPRLVVVVDEFGELLEADPEMLAVLTRVGRLGRSLGVHLVLATQRLDEGRLRGLESHLRWRICLRTFSEAESRAAIGVPDAAHLPPVPGPALLSVDGSLRRFTAAWTSAPVHPPDVPAVQVLSLESAREKPAGPTERDVVVQRVLDRRQPRAAQVCLPPLGSRLELVPRGSVVQLDQPELQAQPWIAPTWTQGHLAVVGAPRSGRTTALLACAAALLEVDPDVRLVLLGPDLAESGWSRSPAVWAAAGQDLDHQRDVVATVTAALGRPPGEPPLLVLVDGVAAVRAEVDLGVIAERGPARGIHLALAGHRWSDLGPLRDLVTQRWELALVDRLDSLHGPSRAALLRDAPPGRVLDGLGRLGQVRWPGAPPQTAARRGCHPRPDEVLRPLPEAAPVLAPVHLGLRAGDLAPVGWDPADGPLLVVGGPGSGRTTVLERIAQAHPGVAVVDDSEARPGVVGQLLAEGTSFAVVRRDSTSGRAAWDPDLALLRDHVAAALVLSGDPQQGPLVLGVPARSGPPGRGTWVRRGAAPVMVRCAAPGGHLRVAA